MNKKTVTIHIYTRTCGFYPEGNVTVFDCDFRDIPSCMKDLLWLGHQDVEIEVPDIDLAKAQIDNLEQQINEERVQSQVRVNLLLERISKLQAIGHEG